MDRDLIVDVRTATFRYPRTEVPALAEVTLGVAPGELVAVLGPNGSGKTTLLRVALGLHRPVQGTASILGRPAHAWPRRDLARLVGVVTQREENLFPQRVRETVALGRYPHLPRFGAPRSADHAAVAQAMARCGVAPLAERWLWSLSGGEYQRARIARALAQEPRLLVLDEPTAALDLRFEMELFELARALVDREGLAIILVTHDVNLAARFADRVLLLSTGRPAGLGRPAEVLTAASVAAVFGWPVAVAPFEGAPQIVPLRHPAFPRES